VDKKEVVPFLMGVFVGVVLLSMYYDGIVWIIRLLISTVSNFSMPDSSQWSALATVILAIIGYFSYISARKASFYSLFSQQREVLEGIQKLVNYVNQNFSTLQPDEIGKYLKFVTLSKIFFPANKDLHQDIYTYWKASSELSLKVCSKKNKDILFETDTRLIKTITEAIIH
jgi:hypothetical protein